MSLNKGGSLDRDRYQTSRQALKADALKAGEDATMLTVTDVEEVETDDPEQPSGKRTSLVLQSEEYPTKGYFLNGKGLDRIIGRYGDVPSVWIGKPVALEKVRTTNPRAPGSTHYALWVAESPMWEEILAAYNVTTPVVKTAAPRTVATPTRKVATPAKKTATVAKKKGRK